MVGDGDIRIGTAEREEALAALAEHHAAGRLDANEYEDRRGRATDAVLRRELTALFVDLPEPRPKLRPSRSSALAQPSTSRRPSAQGKVARTLVSLSPFIAIAAFFLTRSWLAFLLIPVIAILARTIDD
ncbi:DUF1707 SHOCT-like domain-containing protein [Terrabacter terrigena]|uniref:DUF1707 domain-containing protein n=1 Tax=Terrabacter terrigena TaxID=574718 RepID=A0ABW3MTN7_9MICO